MKLRRLPQPNPTAGFTLIEMLAVIVIVAVLAAISAPSWLAYATRQRMTAVESDLVQVLKQAQQTAIAQRRTVTVEINEDADIPTVVIMLNGSTRTETLGPGELRPGMIELEAAPADNSAITEISFDYQGTIRNQGDILPFVVNINPSNGNQRQCAMVTSLLGNVKTSRNADDCDNLDLD